MPVSGYLRGSLPVRERVGKGHDAGAAKAVQTRGKSLLATGVNQITGRFARGDVLMVRDPRGREIARGLSNYTADELRLIMGKRSNQFAKILSVPAYDEVIHRDNLVLLTSSASSPRRQGR